VLGRDGMEAFRDLRRLLQYIQWQHYRGLGRRWLLKTPSLFGFEGAMAAAFPGTDFVVTHRHPAATWPSMCTLFVGVRSVYSDADMTAMATPVMLHNTGEAAKMHLAWREQCPPEKVLDVAFGEVMSDESAACRRVYDFLGMEYSDAADARVHTWIEMDAGRGHARSTKTLADFGVDEETINAGFAAYIERYRDFILTPVSKGT
jgi:hypothetical protein